MTDHDILPWQQADWQRLQQMRDRLPHALLFNGSRGIGKLAFAERFAAALLCERPRADGHACGACESCGWFAQYAHPDYRRVRPEALDSDADAEPDPDEGSGRKAGKTASKDIRIEQIRALAAFMNVSTHRSGMRVVLLYPAEALNAASANALLKTLEEPPPETVFLLVTDRIDRLLPTIVSRCRKFPLTVPDIGAARVWLEAQGVPHAERWLAEQGGAPLAAQEAAQGEHSAERDELLAFLAKPDASAALVVAERLQKTALAQLVAWQQRWLYDLLSLKLGERVRYFPHQQQALAQLAARSPAVRLQQAARDAGARRAVADHPLAARLFIEQMLLDYTGLFR